jgi:ribosome-binding factor A
MASKRQLKFARLIQKELGDIFLKETKDLFGNIFITVTHTEASPDLSFVKVYLSFLLTNNVEESFFQVQEKTKDIRKMLGARIKKDVRIIPEIAFFLDNSAAEAIKMETIINNLIASDKDKKAN